MNHRIAILSDIHGDTTALEAVIADARALGATEYWLLGDILLPGPGRDDLFELLDAIPITAAVRGNWDDCVLEALDGEYGLEDPQEIQLLRLTQYLMEGLDPKRIDWLRSLPLVEKKEVNGIRFSLTHNLPEKNYGGDLRPATQKGHLFQAPEAKCPLKASIPSRLEHAHPQSLPPGLLYLREYQII